MLYVGQVGHSAAHQVNQSARRGHHDVHSRAQGPYLRLYVGAAIHGQHPQLGQVFRKTLQVVGNLQAQFTRGAQHQRLDARLCIVLQPLQHGQAIGSRLPGSCLGQRYEVGLRLLFREQPWNHFLLYGHRMLISLLPNGLQQLVAQAQILECFHLCEGRFNLIGCKGSDFWRVTKVFRPFPSHRRAFFRWRLLQL